MVMIRLAVFGLIFGLFGLANAYAEPFTILNKPPSAVCEIHFIKKTLSYLHDQIYFEEVLVENIKKFKLAKRDLEKEYRERVRQLTIDERNLSSTNCETYYELKDGEIVPKPSIIAMPQPKKGSGSKFKNLEGCPGCVVLETTKDSKFPFLNAK